MSVSYFNRKDEKPTTIVFENGLKVDEFRLWRKFSSSVEALYPDVETSWVFPSQKLGWLLSYGSGKTILFYIVPDGFCFHINFILQEAAVTAVRDLDLPTDVMHLITHADKIEQGYSFYLPIRSMKDVQIAETLTQVQYETSLK
jgi:hypothetical protein